jgi:hypothetical protein
MATLSEEYDCFYQDIEAALLSAGLTRREVNRRETFASKEKVRKALALDVLSKDNKCNQCLIILANSPRHMPDGWIWPINGRFGDICNGCYSDMTKDEKYRMNTLSRIGCIVCKREMLVYKEAEIHHIRTNRGVGRKKDHSLTIPLCPEHHRVGEYGMAIHAGQSEWELRHGTELELLQNVDELLLTFDSKML